jgi:cystathionine beta-synthase
MEILDSALEAIGRTPMIRLARLHPAGNLVAKVEYTSIGGSVKDRIAITMIERAEKLGLLEPGGTIVEPTSGNTGVGLAIVGAVRGYRVICTVPDKVSQEKQALLRAYGAEVVVTPTELPPEDPDSYYGVARKLAEEIPGAYSPNQYTNPANPDAHRQTTGPEVWEQTEGQVAAFVVGTGTGGTISGAGRYLKEQNPGVLIVGVDPEGSIYTARSADDVHQYHVEGVGEDFWPETLDADVIDRWIAVDDRASFEMARRIARTEGLLVGGSGGLAVVGAIRVAEELEGQLVVVLLPDSGRGYLSKAFKDEWMRDHGLLED